MLNNKLQKIGDTLIIDVKPKHKGRATLTGFTDTWVGLLPNRNIRRQYRIIEDEMFYSDWMELTNASISGKVIKQNNIIQVKYTRIGSNEDGEIEFTKIDFQGDFEPENIISPVLDNSMFSSIAWNENTERLAKNLFKKLYYRGIIPMYIHRGDNLSVDEDRDYIDLFYAIAKFFAIIMTFFKRFENFYNDEELMLEWIRQNGLQFDETEIDIEQLKYLAKHFLSEVSQRGTKMIFNRQGDVVNGKEREIDGEFIRLIRSKQSDELMYENIPFDKMGWCLGNSSPLYRGTMFSDAINKTREQSKDFQDERNFVTFHNGFADVSISEIDSRKSMLLETTGLGVCGLGRYEDEDVSENIYVADPMMDYEITFMLRVNFWSNNTKLSFGVDGFDVHKISTMNSFITTNNDETIDWFIKDLPLEKLMMDKWYLVRGIIHSYGSTAMKNDKLNIGFGHNLCFNNKFIKYILPKIHLSSNNTSSVYIWDYKIRPLVRGTNILKLRSGYENSYSLGFIQAPRIFYSWFRNNNNNKSNDEITNIIERYLLPFNMVDILQFIEDK